MNRLLQRAAAWVFLAATTSLAAQGAVIFDTTYSWTDAGAEPDQQGRVFRDGIPSEWDISKVFPGVFDTNPRDYVAYTLNSGIYSLIQVTTFHTSPGAQVFSVTYSIFNPADVASGYLADAGSSFILPNTAPYQFNYAASTDFTVVINAVDTGQGVLAGTNTRLLVEGFTSEVPEPVSMALVGLGLAAVGIGARWRHRRKSGS